MEMNLLREFVIICALSITVLIIAQRLRLPAIIGFLVTGILAGPHGLGLVREDEAVHMMAEVGIIFLLFTVGMELSVDELVRLRVPVLIGGILQVGLTVLTFQGIARLLGYAPNTALLIGFLVSLSSTAIVLKLLQERSEVHSPQGRLALAMLIFQDLIIVPMVLIVPFLAGDVPDNTELLWMALKALGVIAVIIVAARYIVPIILYAVVRTRLRELFLMATLVLCLSVALLTSSVGLSLSLGAFMAGLIMSRSEYSLAALQGVLPFRDVFTSVFFISVGMLMNPMYAMQNIGLVLLAAVAMILVKAILATGTTCALGFPLRPAILAGMSISQVGEFSFILAQSGITHKVISTEVYQLFLSSSIITMALTPFLINFAPKLANWIVEKRVFAHFAKRRAKMLGSTHVRFAGMKDHMIIVGFGLGGRHIAQAARSSGIPYVIIEMNPDTVRRLQDEGEPIMYGDASHPTVLEYAGLERARAMVIVISDPAATRAVTAIAKELHPDLHIVARTRFVTEIDPLIQLGADDVVAEEFETSIEVFTRVLAWYLVPPGDIEKLTAEARSGGYGKFRQGDDDTRSLCTLDAYFLGMEVSAREVEVGSFLDGITLKEADLRHTHRVTVVAIRREAEVFPNPDGNWRFEAGDVAYLFASHKDIADHIKLFRASL